MKDLVIGMDIGGTHTTLGLVDRQGNLLYTDVLLMRDFPIFQDFLEEIIQKSTTLMKQFPDYTLYGVGVGAPNSHFYTGTIRNPINLPWRGTIPFVELLTNALHVPVVLDNDANIAAVGEHVFGAAQQIQNFVVLTLGTGLGSGIFIDGKLLHGHSGFAGEIGHWNLVPKGRECACGGRGCAETYVSATGICRTALELLCTQRDNSPLRDLAPRQLSSLAIYNAAINGDRIAQEAFKKTGGYLGKVIANTVAFSSPEAVFLFGGLVHGKELFLDATKQSFQEHLLLPTLANSVDIKISALQDSSAALLGAAALIWGKDDS